MGDNSALLAHDEPLQQLAEVAAANGTAPSATFPHKKEDSEDEEADANNSWTEEEDLQLVTAMVSHGLHNKTGIKTAYNVLRDDSEFKVTLRPQTSFEGFYKRAGRLKERSEYYDKLLRQVREEKAKKTNRYVWDDGEESLLIDAHLSYIKKLQIQYAKPPDLKMTEECWRHVLLDVKGDPKFKVFFDRSRTPKAMETRWQLVKANKLDEIRQHAEAQGCHVVATNAVHQAELAANNPFGAGPSAPASGTLQPHSGDTNGGTFHKNPAFEDGSVSRIESMVAEQVQKLEEKFEKRKREEDEERKAVQKKRRTALQALQQQLQAKQQEEEKIERKKSAAPQTQNDLKAVIEKADAELAQILGDFPVVNERMETESVRKTEAEEAVRNVQEKVRAEQLYIGNAQTQLAKSREVLANAESRKQEAQAERERTLHELETAQANYDQACAEAESAINETDSASRQVEVDEQMVSQARAKVDANADTLQTRLALVQSERKEAHKLLQAEQKKRDALQERRGVAEKKKQNAEDDFARNSPEELDKELSNIKSEIKLLQLQKDDLFMAFMASDP